MRCPNCGTQIDDDSVFCFACGGAIDRQNSLGSSHNVKEGSIWNSPEQELEDDPTPLGVPHEFSESSDSIAAKVCPYCGWKVDRNKGVCLRCGRRIPTLTRGAWEDYEDDSLTSLMNDGETANSQRQAQGHEETAPISDVGRPADQKIPMPPTPARKKKGPNVPLIAGIAVGVAVLVVGIIFVARIAFAPKEAQKPEPVEEFVPGSLYGHLSMSDADYGTADFKDAIILDVDDQNHATLVYRGNDLSGTLERVEESDDTYTYNMEGIKDGAGKELKNATVRIEVPNTFTPDNLAGIWRISYVNKDKKYSHSDWAIVNNDNTGVAGFSEGFDVFSEDRDFLKTHSSRRSWKKLGKGCYRITAPDKNGVERVVYVSG